jgi:subfamily B ATP-binding cassette protein HlyB/CyaB
MTETAPPAIQASDARAPDPGAAPAPPDSGALCLTLLLRVLGIAATPEQIRHQFADGDGALSAQAILRCAKAMAVKARLVRPRPDRLGSTPLPALAARQGGGWFILARIADGDNVLIHDPAEQRPRLCTQAELAEMWDGRLILVTRRAGIANLASRFDIRWFVPAILKYRRILGEVLIVSFALQMLGLISPMFFQVVVDKVLVHRGLSTLDILVVGLLLVSLFETILGALRTYAFAHTTTRIDVELGSRLFRHLLALPISYFEARRVGDSVARVRELENMRNFLTSSALTLVIDLFFTVVFIAVMFWYSPILSWIVVASIPCYVIISVLVTPVFRDRLDDKFARGAENQAFLVEAVTGVETLKAMAVEPQMQRRWEEQLAGYVRASFRTVSLGNVASQVIGFISKVVTALTLWFGAKLVIDGDLTVGELVAFNMLSGRVSQPVLRIAQLWQDFQQARLSIARLGDILNAAPEVPARSAPTALPSIQGAIAFDHVSFRYRLDGPAVLSDVSLAIKPGEVIGIVGSSGSGKSTLTKLIQRLHVPAAGRVLIDGVDIALADPAWLRRQVGVVLQENVLFNRSVRENIALADPGMPLEAVIAAAKLAGAHDFILELPEGYDTQIGERGTTLSGGQRQRIAIARALVMRPRILILDEATSALDYESERAIQDNMERICAGRTVVIIAHRLSTVRRAHRIVALERGRLIEEGTHDELVRSGGRYARLFRLQAGVQEAV